MKEFLELPTHQANLYANSQIGKYVEIGEESLRKNALALLCVDEFRGTQLEMTTSFSRFKKNLYLMSAGNWKLPLVDLGILRAGNEVEDTYFALKDIIHQILVKGALPIIIGGSQDLLLSLYQPLTQADKPLNFTSVDYSLPLEQQTDEKLRERNVLNHLLADSSQLLFQFTNIGYQSFYTPYQVVDSVNQIDFDTLRLGEITQDMKESEPYFRSSDLISFNMNSVESFASTDRIIALPNGFNSREICAMSKFAGMSPQLKVMSFFNYFENTTNALFSTLMAQILWYFIEGKNLSLAWDKKTQTPYMRYTVLHEDKEIVFYKDKNINKWWISITHLDKDDETLIPCTQKDYEKAKNNELPDRYWKNLKRFL